MLKPRLLLALVIQHQLICNSRFRNELYQTFNHRVLFDALYAFLNPSSLRPREYKIIITSKEKRQEKKILTGSENFLVFYQLFEKMLIVESDKLSSNLEHAFYCYKFNVYAFICAAFYFPFLMYR